MRGGSQSVRLGGRQVEPCQKQRVMGRVCGHIVAPLIASMCATRVVARCRVWPWRCPWRFLIVALIVGVAMLLSLPHRCRVWPCRCPPDSCPSRAAQFPCQQSRLSLSQASEFFLVVLTAALCLLPRPSPTLAQLEGLRDQLIATKCVSGRRGEKGSRESREDHAREGWRAGTVKGGTIGVVCVRCGEREGVCV